MKTVIAATALAILPLAAYSATVSKQAMQDVSSYFHISTFKQANKPKNRIICRSIKQAFFFSVSDRNLKEPPRSAYKQIRSFQHGLANEPHFKGTSSGFEGPGYKAAQGSFVLSKAFDKKIINLVYFNKAFQDSIPEDFHAVEQYCLVDGNSHPANPKWKRLK